MEAAWAVPKAAPHVPTMEDHLNVTDAVQAMFYQGLTAAKLGSNSHLIMPVVPAEMSIPVASSAPLTLTQVKLYAQPAKPTTATSSLGAPVATPTTINTLMAVMDAKFVQQFWWGVWNATLRGSRAFSVPTVMRMEDFWHPGLSAVTPTTSSILLIMVNARPAPPSLAVPPATMIKEANN